MRALIIEDEPAVAFTIQEHLSELGFTEFDLAATEQAALALARARSPDLIIADVALASGNGIAAVEKICRDKNIPVVFVTGRGDEVHRELPSAVVVPKPFESSDLAAGYLQAWASTHLRRTPFI
jgi:DNA-binding response OmpR family regulator